MGYQDLNSVFWTSAIMTHKNLTNLSLIITPPGGEKNVGVHDIHANSQPQMTTQAPHPWVMCLKLQFARVYHQLILQDVPLRTRRALSLYNVYMRTVCESISSVESQKGAINIQRCSVENQKGTINIHRCSLENHKGTIAVQCLWRYSTLLVLNGTSLNNDRALLALNWPYPCGFMFMVCIHDGYYE